MWEANWQRCWTQPANVNGNQAKNGNMLDLRKDHANLINPSHKEVKTNLQERCVAGVAQNTPISPAEIRMCLGVSPSFLRSTPRISDLEGINGNDARLIVSPKKIWKNSIYIFFRIQTNDHHWYATDTFGIPGPMQCVTHPQNTARKPVSLLAWPISIPP